ncbi:MAG: type VI-C CRISPR-associated RNA-guided ribonuclease Cas13c, partial [Psychrilyobacter sp.]|uniref:type VI-C CRISPR-associated RNA-guided ribonuclease Cas13c n=1 Tax=Psychrilyobacter sp. TaxID=2586924 RepID=UPI003C7553DB
YKDLYNKKKEKVEEQNKLIEVGRNDSNKKAITDINKELKKLKDKMEKITKLNSKFRLQYKLQMAYGFLQKEYNLDLKKFGDWFEPSKESSTKEFQVRWLEYLKETAGKDEFNFGILEKNIEKIKKSEERFLTKDKSNNLVKLYILIYLLIPVELRGDFLGFVKKNYYDMKNVDQLSEDIEVKDEFFHKLRLFEKNSKKFEILSYEMIEYSNINEGFTKVYESLGIDISKVSIVQFVGLEEKRIFDKNIILPMMKYYQNIFKLINDVEIHALFKLINRQNITFEVGIERITKKTGHFQFSNLMKQMKNGGKSKENEKEIYGIRNDIAHINYSNLFLNPLTGTPLLNDRNDENPYKSDKLSRSSLSERVDNFIEKVESISSNKSILGVDIVNDYYMKKEQFLFNLKSTSEEDITSIEKKRKLDQEEESLRRYNLKKRNLPNIFKKYMEIVSNLEDGKKINSKLWSEIKDLSIFIDNGETIIIKDLSIFQRLNYINQVKGLLKKEASQLLGIYRKYVIQNIKAQLLDIFIRKEKRFIRVEAFGNRFRKKKDYELQLQSNEGVFKVETILKNNKVIMEESIDDFKFKVEGCMIRIFSSEEKLLNEKNLKTKYIQKVKLSSKK